MAADKITSLRADLRNAAKLLTHEEARYLVDLYYQMQEFRKGAGNEIGALNRAGETESAVLKWVFAEAEEIEKEIKRALDRYTDAQPMGQWAKGIHGIGPVIAAGLLANIEFKPWRCTQPGDKRCKEKEPHEGCGRREPLRAGRQSRPVARDQTSAKVAQYDHRRLHRKGRRDRSRDFDGGQ